MRPSSTWLWLTILAAASFAALGACGDDEGSVVTAGSGDAGVPPVAAAFGLDARPVNATCLAPRRPAPTAAVSFTPVYQGVAFQDGLMAMAQPPGNSSQWFAALRNGLIVAFPAQGITGAPDVVANIPQLAGMPVQAGGEGGLLGFAFHPEFATNGYLFVSWTTTGGPADMRSTVGRVTSSDGGQSFSQYTTIVEPFDQPAQNHNGGGVAFGPDGNLYLSFGDGGAANDAFHHGQNPFGMFAKILRIDVDSPAPGQAYAIPGDNPFATGGGEPSTFAWGLRNPFRFSFDRASGDLWAGDVGQNAWEEIDRVVLGGNYGWPCREGKHDFSTDPALCPNPTGLIDPVHEYPHTGSASVTGGIVYRGSAIPGFVGTYVFGDYATEELFALSFDPTSGDAQVETINAQGPFEGWSGFAEDRDAEVYALSLFPPAVYKLVPSAGGSPEPSLPEKLSETGCFQRSNPTKPADGLIPFGVNAQLWSDGADKERFMAIPDGTTIGVGADGDFAFPIGTVLIKTFFLAGRRVETRLFVRHEDGAWAGYTYEWNDAQSDAVLLPSSKTKQVGPVLWTFPSRSDCVQCHTEAAGRALGPELGQLNGDLVYASTNRIANQLSTLEHIGMFSAPLGVPVAQIVAYPDPLGPAPAADRARAYLHANCSHCHRPDGPGRGDMDLRFATALADTKTCGATPQNGDLGIAGAELVAPGDPERSLVVIRPRALSANRMPPLATDVVDDEGIGVLERWIDGLSACP